MTAVPPMLLRFGSFQGQASCARAQYAEALALVFGVELHPLTGREGRPQFELSVVDSPSALPSPEGDTAAAPDNMLVLGGTRERPTIATDVLRAELRLDVVPARIRITVLCSDLPFAALCVHFGVIIVVNLMIGLCTPPVTTWERR